VAALFPAHPLLPTPPANSVHYSRADGTSRHRRDHLRCVLLPVLGRLLIPFLLCWLLVAAALFAWRRWRQRPWLAFLACAVVVAVAPVLLRTKWVALLAVIVAVGAIGYLGRKRGR